MVVEIRVSADHRLACRHIFRLQRDAIGREDELGLLLGRGRAVSERGERGRDGAFSTDAEVDVAPLQNRAGQVSELLEFPVRSRLSVGSLFPKASRNEEGKLRRIEGSPSELRDGLFDFDGIHGKRSRGFS